MNKIDDTILKKAETEVIFNLYLYLIHLQKEKRSKSLQEIVWHLEILYEQQKPFKWSKRDAAKLKILKHVISNNIYISQTKLLDYTISENGLTAGLFIKPDNNVSVVFKGTGSGEWIDNGEGLSGIAESNIYITYPQDHTKPFFHTVYKDYATDQQVEALNWYEYMISKHCGGTQEITVSGHSKGGNKAQFIAMKSPKVNYCFSFDGQGFSPEAIKSLKTQLGEKYEHQRIKIYSFCADNDYVNVLGSQLALKKQTYYFESRQGIHYPESILNAQGMFNPQCNQGNLSLYVESISKELMALTPLIRQYAALGIMNIFQKYLGRGETVNGDAVSSEKTIAGLTIAVGVFLNKLRKIKYDRFDAQ